MRAVRPLKSNPRPALRRQGALLDERDTQPGVLLALVTLLLGIVSRSYEGCEATKI